MNGGEKVIGKIHCMVKYNDNRNLHKCFIFIIQVHIVLRINKITHYFTNYTKLN